MQKSYGVLNMHLTDAEALPYPEERLMHPACVAPKSRRVQAHLLVCFLAFVMRKTLEGWMARRGWATAPHRTGRVGPHPSADVVAPTTDGRSIRLRCVVHPTRPSPSCSGHLGLKLPQRLRLPSGIGQILDNVVPTFRADISQTRGILVFQP